MNVIERTGDSNDETTGVYFFRNVPVRNTGFLRLQQQQL